VKIIYFAFIYFFHRIDNKERFKVKIGVKNIEGLAIDSIKAGAIGGIAVGMLSRFIGRPAGAAVGGILAGAIIGGTDGHIVAINSIQDAVTVMLM
jgi:hypothetical protein